MTNATANFADCCERCDMIFLHWFGPVIPARHRYGRTCADFFRRRPPKPALTYKVCGLHEGSGRLLAAVFGFIAGVLLGWRRGRCLVLLGRRSLCVLVPRLLLGFVIARR